MDNLVVLHPLREPQEGQQLVVVLDPDPQSRPSLLASLRPQSLQPPPQATGHQHTQLKTNELHQHQAQGQQVQ